MNRSTFENRIALPQPIHPHLCTWMQRCSVGNLRGKQLPTAHVVFSFVARTRTDQWLRAIEDGPEIPHLRPIRTTLSLYGMSQCRVLRNELFAKPETGTTSHLYGSIHFAAYRSLCDSCVSMRRTLREIRRALSSTQVYGSLANSQRTHSYASHRRWNRIAQ